MQHGLRTVTPAKAGVQEVLKKPGFPSSRMRVNLRGFQCILKWLPMQHRPPIVTPAKAGVQEVLEKPGFPPSRE